MLKKALIAAVAGLIVCGGSAASAKTLKYTFHGFCDGVILTETGGNIFAGTHAGCTNNDPAGGFLVKVAKGSPIKYAAIATSDTIHSTTVYTFYLDLKGLSWFLYDSDGVNFNLINSGTLDNGPPSPRAGQVASTAPGAHRHLIQGPLPLPNQNH